MNNLRELTYLTDMNLPDDQLWQRTFKVLRDKATVPLISTEDNFSVDYDQCWDTSECSGDTFYVPGFNNKKLTGKRPLRTISMLLSNPEIQLKGKSIVNVCPNPYCCNPAHMYVVSNKSKFMEGVRIGIEDSEWDLIRSFILSLEGQRQAAIDSYTVAMQYFNGTMRDRAVYELQQSKKNRMKDLTNDEILINAVKSGSSNVFMGDSLLDLMQFIEKYQLKTTYQGLQKEHRELISSMTDVISYRVDKVQLYGEAFRFIAVITDNQELYAELVMKNIVEGQA